MEHLTVDEIIDFISLTELNNEAIVLSSAVNGHIRKCKDCLKLVKSFQIIYDEFSARNNSEEFRKFVSEEILTEKEKLKLNTKTEEFDGSR